MAVWQYYVRTRSNLVSVILSSILSCNDRKNMYSPPKVSYGGCLGMWWQDSQYANSHVCFDWYINYNRNQTTKLHELRTCNHELIFCIPWSKDHLKIDANVSSLKHFQNLSYFTFYRLAWHILCCQLYSLSLEKDDMESSKHCVKLLSLIVIIGCLTKSNLIRISGKWSS